MDPHFLLQCSSPVKTMQIMPMLRHRGNIKMWHDIGQFFVSQGHTEISSNNASTIIKKLQQPWTSLKKEINSWLPPPWHPSEPPKFYHPIPPTSRMRQDTSTCSTIFFIKNVPARQSILNWTNSVIRQLAGNHSCLAYPMIIMSTSPEHRWRVDPIWRISNGKKIK